MNHNERILDWLDSDDGQEWLNSTHHRIGHAVTYQDDSTAPHGLREQFRFAWTKSMRPERRPDSQWTWSPGPVHCAISWGGPLLAISDDYVIPSHP